jgi:hypothetical protein
VHWYLQIDEMIQEIPEQAQPGSNMTLSTHLPPSSLTNSF